MKRTTYILIGLIVSGLIVIVAMIILISMSGRPYDKDAVFLGGERAEMSLDNIHVVKMFVKRTDVLEKQYVYINGNMTVTSPSTIGESKITYSKNQYLKVNRTNDTLLLELDFCDYNIPEKYRGKNYLNAVEMDVQMSVDSLNSILLYTNGINLNLKEVRMDSLFVHVLRQDVLLDSCEFRSFNIDGRDMKFKAKSSKIENFHLNLDSTWKWELENCEIGTEYLRGSQSHHNSLQMGECKRIIWTPLKKDARLQMTLREKAEIIVTPK